MALRRIQGYQSCIAELAVEVVRGSRRHFRSHIFVLLLNRAARADSKKKAIAGSRSEFRVQPLGCCLEPAAKA